MKRYATISVPLDVKKLLEKAKGKVEWGEFLLDLYKETKTLKSKKAFEELRDLLNEEELKAISESSKQFREGLTLR